MYVVQDVMLEYGSQVYLRAKKVKKEVGRGSVGGERGGKGEFDFGVEAIERVQCGIGKLLFFQILIRNQYLTITCDSKEVNEQVKLSFSSSNNSIWALQNTNLNEYRIFNISKGCYLTISNNVQSPKMKESGNKNSKNQLTFGLSKYKHESTLFTIKIQDPQHNLYSLSPSKPNLQAYKNQPSQNSQNSLLLSSPKNSLQTQNLLIQLLPVQNSVTNLLYQLKFAQEMIKNQPSLSIIHQIVQELIFYSIPQFADNEGLISVPIQKIMAEERLSHGICKVLVGCLEDGGFSGELAMVIERDVRLLCLGSSENSAIFSVLITKILQSFQYKYFLQSIGCLIRNNFHLITKFQSKKWCQQIFQKLQSTHIFHDYETLHKLLNLVSQFCTGPGSIPNKYLTIHTLQRIYQDNSNQRNIDINIGGDRNRDRGRDREDEFEKKVPFWLRMFHEGQFVFVEIDQNQQKFSQIQLENYLSLDQRNQFIYRGQIGLIGALCSGFNINAINKFYGVLKAISSYCYNQTYPYFKTPSCKQSTLQAITNSFHPTSTTPTPQNKHNIIFAFNESSSSSSIKPQKTSKDRTSTYKLQQLKLHKINSYQNQTLTDVYRHFILTFQQQLIQLYLYCEDNKVDVVEMLVDRGVVRERFGGELGVWVRLVGIMVEGRLITMMKKKAGPYNQYFKRMLQSSKSKDKDQKYKKQGLSPSKKKIKGKRYSPSMLPFTQDKDYQTQANMLLDLTTRLISYNPLYKKYLTQLKHSHQQNPSSSSPFPLPLHLHQLLHRSKSKQPSPSSSTPQDKNYNKVIYIHQILLESQRKQYEYIQQIKMNCCYVLAMIYQNIVEESVEYEVKNLGYNVQGGIKFSNKIDFGEGFKKFPFVDEEFKVGVWVNWYLGSEPAVLDAYTTLLRYIYDQNQIQIHALNTTMVLFTKQETEFYQSILPWMCQVQKLSACISSWYIPQILTSSALYYQNYTGLLRALQSINTQLKNPNLRNMMVLTDYQQILQNLGIIDIFKQIIGHLNKFDPNAVANVGNAKKFQEGKAVEKEGLALLAQLAKIMEFYICMNDSNKNKIVICMGEILTSSHRSLKLLQPILQQSKYPYNQLCLLPPKSLNNILQLLPQSIQILQQIQNLQQFQFVTTMERISKIINTNANKNTNMNMNIKQSHHNGPSFVSSILKDKHCLLLFCQIAYRLIRIGGCWRFLAWFFDEVVMGVMVGELDGVNFRTKNIPSIDLIQIKLKSSISYLLFSFYTNQTLKSLSSKLHPHNPSLSDSTSPPPPLKLKTSQGFKIVIQYIMLQCLANLFLENNTNQIKKCYCQYYIFDVLPLLTISEEMFQIDDFRECVLEQFRKYVVAWGVLGGDGDGEIGVGLESKRKIVKGMSMQENRYIPFAQKRQKQLQTFITQGIKPPSLQPRPNNLLQPPPSPPSPPSQFPHTSPTLDLPSQPQQKPTQHQKQSKKAMKTWYKARLALNQKKQNYINRQKWLNDILTLDKQHGSLWEKTINSNDIIAKMISVMGNCGLIGLGGQNQIFVGKCLVGWVDKQIEIKKRKQKQKKSKKPQLKPTYLLKTISPKTIIQQYLQQIQKKLNPTCTPTNSNNSKSKQNVISICYYIKFVDKMIILTSNYNYNYRNSYNQMEMGMGVGVGMQRGFVRFVLGKLQSILQQLIQCFYLHLQLVQQYQQAKVLHVYPLMDTWIPLLIVADIVTRLLDQQKQTHGQAEMECLDEFIRLFGLFLKAKIMFKKVKQPKLQDGLDEILKLYRKILPQQSKIQQESILTQNDLLNTLNILN